MIDLTMTRYFFDRPELLAAINKAERRALSRIGAFIRTRARTDVLKRARARGRGKAKRSREEPSRPGEPPVVRSRDRRLTLRNILFAFDPSRRSVVVGPVKLNTPARNGSTVPNLLEFGGAGELVQWRRVGADRWLFGKPPSDQPDVFEVRTIRAIWEARPFMGPALEKETEAGTIAQGWAGVVTP